MKHSIIFIVTAALTLVLSSCGSTRSETVSSDSDSGSTHTVYVIQNSSNVPMTDVAMLQPLETYSTGSCATVIVADGAPETLGTVDYVSTAKNSAQVELEANRWKKDLHTALAVTPNDPECDLLQGLQLTSRALTTRSTQNQLVVVVSNGISTAGLLKMQDVPDITALDTGEIVERLRDLHEIPSWSEDVRFLWFYLGEAGGTQSRLTSAQVTWLRQLWVEILTAGGVLQENIDFRDDLPTLSANSDVPNTSSIAVTGEDFNLAAFLAGEPLVLEKIRFKGDLAEYYSPDEAEAVIKHLGDELNAAHSSQTYLIVGSTAGETAYSDSALRLSKDRAQRVADDLIEAAPQLRERVVAIGIGNQETSLRQSNNDALNRAVFIVSSTNNALFEELCRLGGVSVSNP